MPERAGQAHGRAETIRVLAVSDEADDALRADLGTLRTAELILACGDLPADYLAYLMDALDIPLVFVPGNHDPDLSGYRLSRAGLTLRAGLPARSPLPEGAINADGKVVDVGRLRVAGLGGCLRYGGGPNQYTERQQSRRASALRRQARWRGRGEGTGIDVLLTHAPPRGVGDGDDPPHHGFSCFHALVAALAPTALLHGHVHRQAPPAGGWRIGRTVVRNVTGRHLIDIVIGQSDGGTADGGRARTEPQLGGRHAG